MSLKALAYKVLERNSSRNQAATHSKNRRNFGRKHGIKNTTKLRPKIRWEEDIIRIIDWVLISEPPIRPFQLHQGIKVVDPMGFWHMLKSDITAGPNGPRTKYGSL